MIPSSVALFFTSSVKKESGILKRIIRLSEIWMFESKSWREFGISFRHLIIDYIKRCLFGSIKWSKIWVFNDQYEYYLIHMSPHTPLLAPTHIIFTCQTLYEIIINSIISHHRYFIWFNYVIYCAIWYIFVIYSMVF